MPRKVYPPHNKVQHFIQIDFNFFFLSCQSKQNIWHYPKSFLIAICIYDISILHELLRSILWTTESIVSLHLLSSSQQYKHIQHMKRLELLKTSQKIFEQKAISRYKDGQYHSDPKGERKAQQESYFAWQDSNPVWLPCCWNSQPHMSHPWQTNSYLSFASDTAAATDSDNS